MEIEGVTQGEITEGAFTEDSVGNIYQEGHENEILVQGFGHIVTVPTDVQSGQPTGQCMHKPVQITKVFDKSSPLLYVALSTGERLSKVSLKFYRTSISGTQEHYFTIELEDAIITNIEARMPNCQDPEMAHFTHFEDVSFTYRKITFQSESNATTTFDVEIKYSMGSLQKVDRTIGPGDYSFKAGDCGCKVSVRMRSHLLGQNIRIIARHP